MIQNNTLPNISTDELAEMIAKGFKESQTNLREFKSEVRSSFKETKKELSGFKNEFSNFRSEVNTFRSETNVRLQNIEENMATKDDIYRLEKRFDGLEKTVFNDHGRRLRKIETTLQIA